MYSVVVVCFFGADQLVVEIGSAFEDDAKLLHFSHIRVLTS